MSFSEIPLDVTIITVSTDAMVQEMQYDPTILLKYTQLVEFNCEGMNLTTLPKLPPTLKTLICAENKLTKLPMLPETLVEIDCVTNNLSSFPTILPPNLKILNFNDNFAIRELPPQLPKGLEIMSGFNCNLTTLPPLPETLKSLRLGNCQLIELPQQLPDGLLEINVTNNKLTTLPHLPDSLTTISVGINNISVIPNIPINTVDFSCDNNKEIRELPHELSNCTGLIYLQCAHNMISELPDLPARLGYLICNNNQLKQLPALPLYIESITCDFNKLEQLPPIPPYVDTLTCAHNNLSRIPVLPISIKTFDCLRNPLQFYPQLTTGEYLKLKFEDGKDMKTRTPNLPLMKYDTTDPNIYMTTTTKTPNLRLVVFENCFACDRMDKWKQSAELVTKDGMGCAINTMRFLNMYDEHERDKLITAVNHSYTPFSTIIQYTQRLIGHKNNIIEKQFDITTLEGVRRVFANLDKWMPTNSCVIYRTNDTLNINENGVTSGHTAILTKTIDNKLYITDPLIPRFVLNDVNKFFTMMQRRRDNTISIMFELIIPKVGGRTHRRRKPQRRTYTRCQRQRRKSHRRLKKAYV